MTQQKEKQDDFIEDDFEEDDFISDDEVGEMSAAPLPLFETTASIVPEKISPKPKKQVGIAGHLGNIAANILAPGDLLTRARNVINPILEPYVEDIIPQLAGQEEGILNPNLSQNPLLLGRNPISRMLVSDPTNEPGVSGFLKDLGRQLVSETVSPLGALSAVAGTSPAEHPALRSTIRIPPRALLPEVAGPDYPVSPKFIAGVEGVAENRPYTAQTGTMELPAAIRASATLTPEEMGGVIDISPELAAQGMTGVGRPVQPTKPVRFIPSKDNTKEIADFVSAGYKVRKTGRGTEIELIPPDLPVQTRSPQGTFTSEKAAPEKIYIGEGTARPGEPQLPSAPPKPSRFKTIDAQAVEQNVPPPIVSPITNEATPVMSAVRRGSGRKGSLPKAQQGEAPRQDALARLIDALYNARSIRSIQDKLYAVERGKRFAKAANVKTPGLAGHRQRLSKMKGELPKVDYESLALDESTVDTLYDIIRQTPNLTEGQKLRAGVGLGKLVGVDSGGGLVPQNNEINLLMEVFSQFGDEPVKAFGKAMKFQMPFKRKIQTNLSEVANFRKAIMASYDLSAPFRQGLPFFYKGEFWRAWKEMIKAYGSENFYNDYKQILRNHTDFDLADRVGLELSDVLTNREEMFASRGAEYVPGVRASNRAYTTYLNKLRMDVFANTLDKMEKIFPDIRKNEVAVRELAHYINTSTGRGSLGSWAGAAEKLNAAFFSPKLIASRLEMFGPKSLNYYKLNPFRIGPEDFTPEMNFIRQEKLKALLAVGSIGVGLATLAKAGGANVSLDPRSSDFLKLRFGNTRVDMLGGFQQYGVLYSRLITGERTSSLNNQTIQYGSRYGYPTRLDAIQDFLINKASPELGLLLRGLIGKGPQGEPINWTQEQIDRSIPILLQDLWKIMQEDPNLLPLAIPAGVGMGVQTYGKKEPTRPSF